MSLTGEFSFAKKGNDDADELRIVNVDVMLLRPDLSYLRYHYYMCCLCVPE